MAALTTAQKIALNSLSPAVIASGLQLGEVLDQILTDLTTGAFGIEADAWDVDSIAKGGGAFSVNGDTTTGLTLGYYGGRVRFGQTVVTVPAGTVSLSASQTNYVEVDDSGTVSANTTGFTAGRVPLYTVVTGTSSITTIAQSKVLLGTIPNGGITGALLSGDARKRVIQIPLGTIAATASFRVILPSAAGTISAIRLAVATDITANDTDYWTFSALRKGSDGQGSTPVLDTGAGNTTKATGGSGLSAEVARSLTLHGTSANLDHLANEVLVFTATKDGSAADLDDATLLVETTFTT